uniref:MLO-like protein n=1 Tax=Cucumis melo TaxID=3656 RepID=A0A9I9D686_CUCME
MSVFCLCFCLLFTGVAASGGDGSPQSRDLDNTPTWAVAAVCFFFVLISIVLENVLHKLGTWLTEKRKSSLYEALEKVKAELMILGFISLLLTFAQAYIVQICIPPSIANSMLPCPLKEKDASSSTTDEDEHHRRLQWLIRRSLAGGHNVVSCKDGKVSLISIDGLHQLHILIFFLAVFHVLFSVITMTLGRVKIRGWKEWEQETLTHNYEFFNGLSFYACRTVILLSHGFKSQFIRQFLSINFVVSHSCFFRQFYGSVSRADYLTLRNGFITVHLAPGSKFNFQRYIKRSLEDDFKIILAVGSKLQAILTRMALEISEKHAVVQGIPLVQGSDNYVTLPIYALVNQMGSGMKRSIFDEQTSKALKKWHETAKKKRAKRASATKTLGGSSNASPLRSLRRFKTTGHSIRVPTYEDLESSDYEGDPSATPTQVSTSESINVDVEDGDEIQEIAETEQSHSTMQSKEGDEFSFIKPAPLG